MAYLTKLFADDNNRKQAERTKQDNLEGQVQTLTLEAIKSAVRQELKEEMASQLIPVNTAISELKTEASTIKTNVSNLDTKVDKIDTKIDKVNSKVNEVAENVAFLKGKEEARRELLTK